MEVFAKEDQRNDPYKDYPIVKEMKKWLGSKEKAKLCSELKIGDDSSINEIITSVKERKP